MKRKALVAGVAMLGSVAAGCGGAPEESPAPPTQGGGEQSDGQSSSSRNAPVKAIDVPDKCSVVSEQQWRELGAVLPPRERVSNGNPGCQYQASEAGTTGWGVFVAVANDGSYSDQLAMNEAPTTTVEVDGYPTAVFKESSGCIIYSDVADQGYLLVNVLQTSPDDPGVDLCQKGQDFAKAAIQNLPNA
ncbi:hypothetical protein GCM10009854_22610 [Saccharopolyspora halophila]|uniref:DUF3558 domain-containing protein n=1 Tax=Saccharopolyspora halophila TaxID=405551 RepID=A0ABN3G6L1_9PSEU